MLLAPFNSASPFEDPIARLFAGMGIYLLAILALVTFLVTYACIRYRARPGASEPRQIAGNTRHEIAWTIAPLASLAILFAFTLHAMSGSDPSPDADPSPDLVIVAHQWWWQGFYPQSNVVVANEIHLPTGARWYLRLESADVVHDWWVPQLGRKMDAIPGHFNFLWIGARRPGVYTGACAEYCGEEHAWMRTRVIAQSPADFQQWIAQQQSTPPPPAGGDAAAGAGLFMQLTCPDCHTVGGTPAKGTVGPNLTHFASRETIGAGVLDNTPQNVELWMSDPQAVKPDCYMPNFHLTVTQVHQLSAYLETLK